MHHHLPSSLYMKTSHSSQNSNTEKIRSNPMKRHINSLPLIILIIVFLTINPSHAKPPQPISQILKINQTLEQFHQWTLLHTKTLETQLKLTPRIAISAFLCFIAASISSAGGIGGGGLFIPILTIVADFDLKAASSFSAFMVTGGSIANVVCNMFNSMKFGGKNKALIDYDIALLSEPCMLLGVSIGVICNVVLPEWIITILFAIFLGWSSFRTCRSGVLYWNLETEEVSRNGFLRDGVCGEGEGAIKSTKVPLLSGEDECKLGGVPWKKLGVLIVVWFLFFFLYLLRGNRYGQSIMPMEYCGVGYWILSSVQIPLAIVITTWILYIRRYQRLPNHSSNQQELDSQGRDGPSNDLVFPFMALLAGALGGVFGIGGGMLISPLLLQVGIAPEVTAATCSFMVFFSSTMSAIQYLLLGMEHTGGAILFAVLCFVASLIGLLVVHRAICKHGRASLIVFSVGIVMVVSTVLVTSFGALDVWRDYTNGKYMGFKLPC